MGGQNGKVDEAIARLASRAHGVVSRAELLGAGLSERQIDGRIRRGSLIVEFPGVYRAGHRAASPEARYMAAVKASGKRTRLHGIRPVLVEAVLARYPNAPGATTLRAIVTGDEPTLLSRLESGFTVPAKRGRKATSANARPGGGVTSFAVTRGGTWSKIRIRCWTSSSGCSPIPL